MNLFDWIKIIHVVLVLLWIVGVSFVSSILLLPEKSFKSIEQRMKAFSLIERRLVWQTRIVLLLSGGSGVWMISLLGGWSWYVHMRFWWVHVMILIWLVFTILTFVGEPLIHQRIVKMIEDNPVLAWHRLRTAHILIWLTLLTTVLCAVGGAQGAF